MFILLIPSEKFTDKEENINDSFMADDYTLKYMKDTTAGNLKINIILVLQKNKVK